MAIYGRTEQEVLDKIKARISDTKTKTSGELEMLLGDLVQVTEPDPEKLAGAVKKAIGSSPLREFGARVGLSASTLSRIINGKITKPLPATMILRIALVSDHAADDTPSLLLELARANGMMSKGEQKMLQERASQRRSRYEYIAATKKMMATILIARLTERGLCFDESIINNDCHLVGGFIKNVTDMAVQFDFGMHVGTDEQQYNWVLWAFPQSKGSEDGIFNPRHFANRLMKNLSPVFLADAWTPELYAEKKLTFCFVDESLYECFCRLISESKLNNRFSAILFDVAALDVKEERSFASRNFPDNPSIFDLPVVVNIVKEQRSNEPEDADEEEILVYDYSEEE